MIYKKHIKDKTIIEQMASIKRNYVNFITTVSRNSLRIKGELQPTSRSSVYTIEIVYQFRRQPSVNILNPLLEKNLKGEDIPHVFLGNKLCLYHPKYKEFKFSDFISLTIVPWTSLWLYHYESWHITGDWLGGGEHPR
jgi:hypothetical protein